MRFFALVGLGLVLAACPDPDAALPDATPAVPFQLTAPSERQFLRPGGSVALTIAVARDPGFAEPVVLDLSSLPAGVTADAATVAADATSATVVLHAEDLARPGATSTVLVTGRAGELEARATTGVLVIGEPGDFDRSFRHEEGSSLDDHGQVTDLAPAPDGMLIVAGEDEHGVYLMRLREDGTPDPAFGALGTVIEDLGDLGTTADSTYSGVSVVVASDGTITAAVSGSLRSSGPDAGSYVALLRYDARGVPDPTFRRLVTVDDQPLDYGAMSAAGDDGWYLTGQSEYGARHFLLRYRADGTLDPSFGKAGVVEVELGDVSSLYEPVLLPDGKLLVTAEGTYGDGTFGSHLRRYRADGTLDPSFGTGGIAGFPEGGAPERTTLLPDGRFVIAGDVRANARLSDAAVWAFLPDGSPDLAFATQGVWTAPATTELDLAYQALLAPDGSLYVPITVYESSSNGHVFARDLQLLHLDAHGVPDESFGTHGVITHFQVFVASWNALLTSDHRIVVASRTNSFGQILRFWY